MYKKSCNIACFMAIASIHSIYSMESYTNQKNYYSIIMPGMNGNGGEDFVGSIIASDQHCFYKTLEDPSLIDFGQDNCIRNLEQQLAQDEYLKANGKAIKLFACGVSQGTATWINWLAQKTYKEQEKLVACLVFEAVLGSGNSAITHTIDARTTSSIKPTSFPLVRQILPWLAKIAHFPAYKPWGKQVFSSAKQLSPKIPIIIMHHINDPQLSINDARRLYCILREQNHNHVYLFEADSNEPRHFNLLSYDTEKDKKIAALHTIYKNHGLPYYPNYIQNIDVNLAEFQPSIKQVEQRMAESAIKNSKSMTTLLYQNDQTQD